LPKGKIVCQDITHGRLERLKRTLKSYLSDEEFNALVDIRLNEGVSKELFDKVKNFYKKIYINKFSLRLVLKFKGFN